MASVGNNWKQIEAAVTQTHLILHLASSNFLEVLHPEDQTIPKVGKAWLWNNGKATMFLL